MNIDAMLTEAEDHHRRGDLEAATRRYRSVLEVDAGNADACYGIGTVLLQQGRAAEAVAYLRSATARLPGVAEFVLNLGLAEAEVSAPCAVETLCRAGRLAGRDVELLVRVLQKLAAMGRDRELLSVADGITIWNPAVSVLIARARARLCDWAGAAADLQSVAAADPQNAAVHRELSTALAHRRDFPGAIAAFRTYLSLSGGGPGDQLAYADLLLMSRRPAEAAAAVHHAMTLGLDSADAELIAARCDRLIGDYDSARRRLRRAVELRHHFGNAWWLLLELEEDAAVIADIADRCHRLARDGVAGSHDAILLALTAGNARDRLGQHDEAFVEWQFGNERQRTLLDERGAAYDAAASEAAFGRQMEIFSGALPPRPSAPATGPIFVVGMPRSGTTLVERMLASLDGVEGGGENEAMEFVASRYLWELGRGRLPAPQDLLADHLTDLVSEYWRRTGGGPRAVTDKLPHNFRHLGLIARLFPQAPVIYLSRDPRDVGLSIYARPFPDGHAYACDLAAIGHFYRQSERLHEHWRRVLPGRILDVGYESLIEDPERVSREIAAFCGLRWDRQCLEFHNRAEASFTFSELQVREALNDRGVARWRRYRRHLTPLLEALGH